MSETSSFSHQTSFGIPKLELPGTIARFGEHELDFEAQELRRSGRAVAIPPQPLFLLMFLTSRAGRIVERAAIRAFLWGDHPPSDANRSLNHTVRKLRRLLNDDARNPLLIQTVHRRGYRFVHGLEWRRSAEPSSGESPAGYGKNRFDSATGLRAFSDADPGVEPPFTWTLAVSELLDSADDTAWPPLAAGVREELLSSLIGLRRELDLRIIDGSLADLAAEPSGKGHPPLELRGSVRRVGHRARIHCRVISLVDRSLVAATGFDLEVTSVFPWQANTAAQIIERLIHPLLASTRV